MHILLYRAPYSRSGLFPILEEFFNLHSPYRGPYQLVESLSYSCRNLQCTFSCIELATSWSILCPIPTEIQKKFSCTERPISQSSQFPGLPEVLNAHSPIYSPLLAGLVSVFFLQKSSVCIPRYRVPYVKIYSLSYSSRSLQCTFSCIRHPIHRCSLCLPPEAFNAYSLV